MLGRPILNVQDFYCPKLSSFNHTLWCSLPSHKYPNVDCATKTAHSLYYWLMYHLQTKSYVMCIKDMSRHSSKKFHLLKTAQYGCKEGDFRLNTTKSYRIARLYLGKQYIGLRLGDLQYLSRMFHVLQNQLKVYTLSLSDVLTCVTVALTSVNYVEQAPNVRKDIVYSQLFDEHKTAL